MRPTVTRLLAALAALVGTLTWAGTPGTAVAGSDPVGAVCAPLDVVIVLDSTTSMDPAIANVKEQLDAFLDRVEVVSGGDYRMGLVDFGRGVEVHVPFGAGNRDAVATELPTLRQTAGNFSGPEAWDEALQAAVRARPAAEGGDDQVGELGSAWRAEANKLVVLVTDARPAGYDDGFDPEDAARAADAADAAKAGGIAVMSLFVPNSNADEAAEPYLQDVATRSGGAYFRTASDGSNLAEGLDLAVRTCGADRDGDGLFDTWEENGIDVDGNGIVDLDLPALGADPDHKDLFVQVSWMAPPTTPTCRLVVFCTGPPAGFDPPDATAWARVGDAFGAAPVTNPDGTPGIRLHVDAGRWSPEAYAVPEDQRRGGELPETEWREVMFASGDDFSFDPFETLRSRWMPAERALAFTFAVYVPQIFDGTEVMGLATGIPSDSVLIAGRLMDSSPKEAVTVLHELGHTLGLGHGGMDHVHHKPNYLSVMNYSHALRNGLVVGDAVNQLELSRWLLAPLDERRLDEPTGITSLGGTPPVSVTALHRCDPDDDGTHEVRAVQPGEPVDWNCDGDTADTALATALRGEDGGAIGVLESWDDWANLRWTGGERGGLAGDPGYVETEDDLTEDDYRATPKPFALAVTGGGTVAAPPRAGALRVAVTVENIGEEDDRYEVAVDGTGGAEAALDVDALDVPAGDAATVTATVDLPDTFDIDRPPAVTVTFTSTEQPTVVGSATVSFVEADPDDAPEPSGELDLDPDEAVPGDEVTVQGSGFGPGTTVTVWAEPALGPPFEATADGDGDLDVTLEVPDPLPDEADGGVEVFAAGVAGDGEPVLASGELDLDRPRDAGDDRPDSADDDAGIDPAVVVLAVATVLLVVLVAWAVARTRAARRTPGKG